jgi:hypothetical protein
VLLSEKQRRKLREAVDDYIARNRWPTLVSRAYDMGEESSVEEFRNELYAHVVGILSEPSIKQLKKKGDQPEDDSDSEEVDVPEVRGRLRQPHQRRSSDVSHVFYEGWRTRGMDEAGLGA